MVTAATTTLTVVSFTFMNNEFIPIKYTCDEKNINPDLMIGDIPLKNYNKRK